MAPCCCHTHLACPIALDNEVDAYHAVIPPLPHIPIPSSPLHYLLTPVSDVAAQNTESRVAALAATAAVGDVALSPRAQRVDQQQLL